jgi:hypothetical protein
MDKNDKICINKYKNSVKVDRSGKSMYLVDNSNTIFKRSYVIIDGEKYFIGLSKFEMAIIKPLCPISYTVYNLEKIKLEGYMLDILLKLKSINEM